jgi:hypothetical protein
LPPEPTLMKSVLANVSDTRKKTSAAIQKTGWRSW